MKKTHLGLALLVLLIWQSNYSQNTSQDAGSALAATLNETMSTHIQLTFERNEGVLQWGQISKKLALKHSLEIAKDSIAKEEAPLRPNDTGRYTGPIFWVYDFNHVASSNTSFKANSSGKLFFKLEFEEKEAIVINSRLNEYTSHHKLSDAAAAKVHWSGETYISVLLQPKYLTNTIQFNVRGITISGKFQREDQQPMDNDYSKQLRNILKREFQLLFEDLLLTVDTAKEGFISSSIHIP